MAADAQAAGVAGRPTSCGWEYFWLITITGLWTFGWLLREPGMLQGLDYSRFYFPHADWLRRRFLSGELPWWNPHVGLGRPYFADLQTGVLYPPNWLHALLGVPVATILIVWGHLAMLGKGVLRIAASLGLSYPVAWGISLAFALGPAVSTHIISGQIQYFTALCYLPWLLLLLLRILDGPCRRSLVLFAMLSALQMLCGHPQVYWLTHFGLGIFAIVMLSGSGWRSAVAAGWRLAAAVLLGLALTAPVLLPFLELIGQSNRAESSTMLSTQGAMGLHDWLGLIVPPHDGFVPDMEGQVLVGLPALMMAAAALWFGRNDRRVRSLAILGLIAGLLASVMPRCLHDAMAVLLPGFSSFRLHARLSIWVVFVVLLLAGWWLARRQRPWWVVASTLGLVILGIGTAWPRLKRWYVMPAEYPAEVLVAGLLHEMQAGDTSHVPLRLNISARLIRENSGMMIGHSTFNGYVALYLERVWEYVHAAAGLAAPETINTFPDVRIFERDPFLYNSMSIVAGFDNRTKEMRFNPMPDPRTYLCYSTDNAGNWRAAVNRMVRGWDFHRTALVESSAPALHGTGHGRVSITMFKPERVTLNVESDKPGILVLAEAWYPGWHVVVGGIPTDAFPVNGWMRGVLVPAGRTEIVWEYHQRWVGVGIILAAAAGALLFWLWRSSGDIRA